jgi:hypothetical protein
MLIKTVKSVIDPSSGKMVSAGGVFDLEWNAASYAVRMGTAVPVESPPEAEDLPYRDEDPSAALGRKPKKIDPFGRR